MPQALRRKSPPPSISPSAREAAARPLQATAGAHVPAYVGLVALARKLGLVGVVALAPLGALVGTVSACGGAAPVQPWTDARDADAGPPDGRVAAQPTIAPTAAATGASAPTAASATATDADATPAEPSDALPPSSALDDAAPDAEADATAP
jgi:hypothetical protein